MDFEEIALEILKNVCDTDEISEDPDMDLFEAGFIDSLAVINIILEIEEKFNLRLQPTDLTKTNISTINHFKSFLEKLEKSGKISQ
ncbi:phosphopantetheine-binding protein [Caproicibacter fermentans]|uniref:D-alanyl carrier protein n=1 Tax=Caproicibacter fermentans TaxID=2576756 RepID=A0A7G8TF61_9FIRM|nr:phosphopantetheine-binding protein [Caproicibacter fermentans]QNK42252.1 D-alanine--poly(phosphoribitol) ligase subunit 2 [Caproicibacter fermentans]